MITKEEKRKILNEAASVEDIIFGANAEDTPPIPEDYSTIFEESSRPSQLDISDIKVPDDFVTSVVEGKVSKPAPKVEPVKPALKPQELITQFIEVINTGKRLIQEMTSCGMIGVNSAPQKKKEKVKKKKSIQDIVNSVLQKR